ncbi:barstar family protein [Neisseria elongata]|uniref:barstar family protein n=1 Tax=Neisseria elongata TaxID=495 RepID=UPI0028ED6C7C|nr:barstar family protein [Neisseria elongata]
MPISPTRNEHIFRLHGIKHSRAFFKLVQQTLMLPDYFGGSWNAPDDCMRDLS